MAELGKGTVITWYDVLGLLPGASAEQVKHQHDAKVSLLRPALLTGAPSPVVTAATRARKILDAAQRVLADPDSRARYDAAAGIRGDGGGLVRRGGFRSEPGSPSDDGLLAGNPGAEMLGALLALSDWLTPHPAPPRRVTVPDVRGLFFSVCLGITGKLGLRVASVRLTAHPMPVDGLVVAQSPKGATRARRGSALTVEVWHPPARSVIPGQVIG